MRLLTVCTHNRTRSVMMAALLGRDIDERLGSEVVEIRSSGFVRAGLPPIDPAVEAMARRGLDVAGHRSAMSDITLLDGADLIITAERDHVIRIATRSPTAYRRAMTLPELLQRVTDVPLHTGDASGGQAPLTDTAGVADASAGDGPELVRAWAESLTADRSAQEYLRRDVPEVADPTGSLPRAFDQAVVDLEHQCRQAADILARLLDPPV